MAYFMATAVNDAVYNCTETGNHTSSRSGRIDGCEYNVYDYTNS